MLRSIRLQNYKGFLDTGNIVFKPITIIFGKNSSGKSSICKLLPILRDAIANRNEPLPLVSKENVRIAYRYEDLFHDRIYSNMLGISMDFDNRTFLKSSFFIQDGVFCDGGLSANFKGKLTGSITVRAKKDKKSDKLAEPFIGRKDPEFEKVLDDCKFSANFIGPIRANAPEFISKSDMQRAIARDAGGAYAYMELMKSEFGSKDLISKVSDWMKANMDSYEIEMYPVNDYMMDGYVPIIKKDALRMHLSDVGEGITQVIPIIVQSFLNEPNSLTVLEQPALHLHPAIHSSIAERLAMSTIETGQTFVIESHSHNLLLGFQRMVAKSDSPFTSDDIEIYFIDNEDGNAVVKKITIDSDGTLSDWPSGVFEEGFEITKQIIDKK